MTAPTETIQTLNEQTRALLTQLHVLAEQAPGPLQSTWTVYLGQLGELAQFLEAGATAPVTRRARAAVSQPQWIQFGRLLRDRRNAAGLSRVQLANRAKISDVTVKFIETARHPPSRATLLRLVGVAELGLRWSDTPSHCSPAPPADVEGAESSLLAADVHRFDERLSLPVVLEALLVLDELRAGQALVEITAYGARRACCLCGMRSDAWAVDAREAAKLPVRHAAPCPGQLADGLCLRHPVLAELAQKARRDHQSQTAVQVAAGLRATQVERIYGCRSSRELAAQLARVAALPRTPSRNGVSALLLWAMALGPCPVEPTNEAFSEHRTQQLADLEPKRSSLTACEVARLRGVSSTAAWLLSPAAPPPDESMLSPQDVDLCPPDPGERECAPA